jgi:anti-sigma factor RsiW
MTKIGCADVKDLLPEWIRRELPESDHTVVTAHVSSCESCSEEVELLRRIQAAAFSPPASLASEIKSALAAEIELTPAAEIKPTPATEIRSDAGVEHGRAGRFAGWRLPAAASVVLALGTALIWQRTQALPEVGPLGQDPFAVVWPSDDADVAGVPMLADLSDEDLALLLEELGG